MIHYLPQAFTKKIDRLLRFANPFDKEYVYSINLTS